MLFVFMGYLGPKLSLFFFLPLPFFTMGFCEERSRVFGGPDSGFLSTPQPAAALQPWLGEPCWMWGHDPSLPFLLWVAFWPPWLITPPLIGVGNLVWMTQRQKPWELPAKKDNGRQSCLSLAWSLVQHGCVGERHARQQWGALAQGLWQCMWRSGKGD